MSILLVDDFDEERDFLHTVLTNAGYGPVVSAESGRQALELLGIMGQSASPCNPDVILMDLMMPEIDGLEACRHIRSVERLELTPGFDGAEPEAGIGRAESPRAGTSGKNRGVGTGLFGIEESAWVDRDLFQMQTGPLGRHLPEADRGLPRTVLSNQARTGHL